MIPLAGLVELLSGTLLSTTCDDATFLAPQSKGVAPDPTNIPECLLSGGVSSSQTGVPPFHLFRRHERLKSLKNAIKILKFYVHHPPIISNLAHRLGARDWPLFTMD
jgi:hypothetical protein